MSGSPEETDPTKVWDYESAQKVKSRKLVIFDANGKKLSISKKEAERINRLHNVAIRRDTGEYNSGEDYANDINWKPIPIEWITVVKNWDKIEEKVRRQTVYKKIIDMYQWFVDNPGTTRDDWAEAHSVQRFIDGTDCYECQYANNQACLKAVDKNKIPSQCSYCPVWNGHCELSALSRWEDNPSVENAREVLRVVVEGPWLVNSR